MRRLLLTLLVTIFLLGISSNLVYAIIGVGVGTGKIQVEDKLKSGMSYELPSLTVLNTGDESSDYEVSVAYHQDQPQLAPPQDWFEFSPSKFYLEPGGTQKVDIKLNLPIKTVPGDYFAYLEGHPAKKSQSGITTIGVAAAAKLYFTVEPANFFEAIYYKTLGFWEAYLPWTKIAAIVLVAVLALKILKKFFNIRLTLKRKIKEEKKNE